VGNDESCPATLRAAAASHPAVTGPQKYTVDGRSITEAQASSLIHGSVAGGPNVGLAGGDFDSVTGSRSYCTTNTPRAAEEVTGGR
jgi:hypothetical protein